MYLCISIVVQPFTTHWKSQILFRDQVYINHRKLQQSSIVRVFDPDPGVPSEPRLPFGKDLAGEKINL